MPTEIITLLSAFAPLMSTPVWAKAQLLLIGTLLCRGPRRITSILRVLGMSDEKRFEKYHRVLNRDKWSCALGAKILLGLLIALLPNNMPILIAIDETLERRKGKKINAKGCYRDAVRSSQKTVVKCFGLKWICMALIVPLPWSKRPWALPFLTVLAPSKQANAERGRTHRTIVDWTIVMVRLVKRWLKKRWVLIGDGAYACIRLGHACGQDVTLISRLRLDAKLYDDPVEPPSGQSGRKPEKGPRVTSLKARVEDKNQDWQTATVAWYGGKEKTIQYLTGEHLWYTSGEKPLPIRWVLVIDPDNPARPNAFFSTDTELDPIQIIQWFVWRWNIEVTFEETRAHLGVETQRQWSDKAIGRTTPVLMGLYSLACLMAYQLSQRIPWQPSVTAWYHKGDQATFSDVMCLIKRSIWSARYFDHSASEADIVKLTPGDANALIELLSEAA